MFKMSLGIITTKGEIVFDSIMQRDKAYKLLVLCFKPPQQPDLKELMQAHQQKQQKSGGQDKSEVDEEEEEDGEVEIIGSYDVLDGFLATEGELVKQHVQLLEQQLFY